MTTLGIQYMQAKEAERSNKAKEANTLHQIRVQADTADKDRASRELISNLDRASKENIATADRLSKENIATADRQSRESIATADRTSRESIADKDRITKIHIADADRLADVQKARDDRNSRESIADADRESRKAIADADRASREDIATRDRLSHELIENNKVTYQYYNSLVNAMNAKGFSAAQANIILSKLNELGAISDWEQYSSLILDGLNDQNENYKDVLEIIAGVAKAVLGFASGK